MAKLSSLRVDGVPDFNVLHSRKHDDEVQPYAFDILTLDGEDLRPLPLSLRKTNLARLLARRPFRVRQARVPFGGTVLASVAGEQPRGPQFMRITQPLRLPARQRCQPGLIVGSPNDRFALQAADQKRPRGREQRSRRF
jgi:hypothetical protein